MYTIDTALRLVCLIFAWMLSDYLLNCNETLPTNYICFIYLILKNELKMFNSF